MKLRFPSMPTALALISLTISTTAVSATILDAENTLKKQDFWVNRDFDWFAKNIPLIDSPDKELDTTYYYRWELVTRHIVYANPNTGYVFTEFANRPFWSGAYGTISCPAGMQFDDIRWLADPRYARDYMRFWMRHPGAQPRNYSFWAADSAWSIHEVAPVPELMVDLLPDLVKNYEGWEKRGWVEEMGLFWQLGHDDGMEFDINARQTRDILRGGQSLRPSFNSYMWADAKALASIAELAGDKGTKERFTRKADGIKKQLQNKLWDPSRSFFFPMSNQRHEKDGHVIEKHTLTYQTGEFAGSPHGRELHGYVPWAFNLPDAGYEEAWIFLMDEEYFKTPFGPTTIELNDPLFVLKKSCCWWSGQSWPFATSQTLKAMANLLQNYKQDYVNRDDYAELLHTFAISHRKDGKPYIAEALNPFTGSMEFHDMHNRSEHYFHSGFTDLVITGLAGVQPSASDTVTIKPLIPAAWDFFAMDAIPYHGHKLSVVWDRDGTRYGRGKGLQLMINGKTVAQSDKIGKLEAKLPGGTRLIPIDKTPPMNFAVNNDGDFYPRYSASYVGSEGTLSMLCDGEYVYDRRPMDRWSTLGSPNIQDWVEVDLGPKRTITAVRAYVIDDGEDMQARAPKKIEAQFWDGKAWKAIPNVKTTPEKPVGGRPLIFTFPEICTSQIKLILTHDGDKRSALTELQVWGPHIEGFTPPSPPPGNLAYNIDPENSYPKVSASFTDPYSGNKNRAIDGKISFLPNPSNRWTSYESPNDKSDWLELDFGREVKMERVVLHIFDDYGGVRTPKSITLEIWTGSKWQGVTNLEANPAKPKGGMANTLSFKPVSATKLRITCEHIGLPTVRSGFTEIEVW